MVEAVNGKKNINNCHCKPSEELINGRNRTASQQALLRFVKSLLGGNYQDLSALQIPFNSMDSKTGIRK